MPIRNGARFLREALDSVLAQDYPNLEVYISDNASSDDSEAICREYAARDPRVNYVRTDANQGAVWNFNRAFQLARGKYFLWAAYDDVRAPGFVSATVAAMEKRPDAVLCCSGVGFIDPDGRQVEPWTRLERPTGATAGARMRAIGRSRFWLDIYGLIRADALARTRLAQPVWGFDVVLTAELCLAGPVLYVPEVLFLYRVDREKTLQSMARTLGSDDAPGRINVNWTAMVLELEGAIWLSRLGTIRKMALSLSLALRMCVANGLVGSGVLHDARANARTALAGRRYGRLIAIGLLAALAFPLHNRAGRAVRNAIRGQRRATA